MGPLSAALLDRRSDGIPAATVPGEGCLHRQRSIEELLVGTEQGQRNPVACQILQGQESLQSGDAAAGDEDSSRLLLLEVCVHHGFPRVSLRAHGYSIIR